MRAKLFLFGTLKLMAAEAALTAELEVSKETLYDTGSPKTQALLAYFALHHNHPIERRRLAFLLWPRATESAARRNLRQYLHRLRQVLEPLGLQDTLQDIDGGRILFDPTGILWMDVLAFKENLEIIPDLLANTAEFPAPVEATLTLYQGDLLPDLYDDWVSPLRSYWQQQYLDLLQMLIHHAQTFQSAGQAIPLAQRLLQADPLRESSHRLLMECYYLNDDRARALQQFEQCEQLLREELDAAPMPKTVALYHRLRDGVYEPPASRRAPGPGDQDKPPKLKTIASILPSTVEATMSSFISRRPEIYQLDLALNQAAQGQGQFIVIQGESGVGKTRLVQEWLQANRDHVNLLNGQCREFEAMISYQPLIEVLQLAPPFLDWTWFDPPPPWLSSVANIVPNLATRFRNLPHVLAADGATDRHYLSEGLGRFMLTLAANGDKPLVLRLEDLHWADGATWQFLAYLGWRCAEAPLLILTTCQQGLLSPDMQHILRSLQRRSNQISMMNLARFSPEETRQLAAFLLDDPHPNRQLISRLYQETEGNALFIIETVNAWSNNSSESRRISGEPDGKRMTKLPLGIQASIEARLDPLPEGSRALLSIAATIGRTFNYRVLALASDLPEDEIVNALEDWLSRGLVIEAADGYDFSHDKIRAVAYNEISRARRRIVHRKIAHALETQNDPDLRHPARLAQHFNLSDEPQRALPYLLQAGEMALAVRSYEEAREFGTQAMRLLRQLPNNKDQAHQAERLDLNLQLATAYAFTGDIDRALPILQESERLARMMENEPRLARIFHRSAQLLWLRGQARLADEYARRLLRSAEELDDAALLHAALRMLGRVGIALSTYDDAIAYLLRYAKLDNSLHPPPDLPIIYGYLAVVYARVGSWQRAFESGRRGVELAEAANGSSALAVAHMNLAFIYSERQHWSQCFEIARQVDPFCEEVGFSPYCFMARSLAGRALVHLGEARQGIKRLEQALAWAEATNHQVFTYVVYLFYIEALILDDRPAEALTRLNQYGPVIKAADDRWATATMLRLRAEISTRLPRPDWVAVETDLIAAARLLRQIRARPDLARTYLALRRLYDRAGQLPWSVDCHFRATTIFDELRMIDELREAQGYAISDRQGAVVIPNLALRGPYQGKV